MKKVLKERFEPDGKKELYLSKFSTRKRKVGEGLAEYAEMSCVFYQIGRSLTWMRKHENDWPSISI